MLPLEAYKRSWSVEIPSKCRVSCQCHCKLLVIRDINVKGAVENRIILSGMFTLVKSLELASRLTFNELKLSLSVGMRIASVSSMIATPQQIVRCVKSDIGNLKSGAEYCERIALGSAMNPWSEPQMSANYSEAARLLRAESELPECTHCGESILGKGLCSECAEAHSR